MLAESLVAAPIVSFLINKLASKIWLELGLLWGVDTNRLHTRLSTIKAILDGAAARAIPPSAAVDKWLNDLKDAAYDADDVLDEYHSEALRRKKEDKVSRFFNDTVTFQFRYQMNKKMGDVMKKLDGIAEDRGWLQMSEQFDTPTLLFNQSRETFSAVNEGQVFGRDGDRMKLVDYLINKDNHNTVSILSIVGLGGIGKTTLAKLVYNDITKLVYNDVGLGHAFDLPPVWIWVSPDFSVQRIMNKIIEGITGKICDLTQIQTMNNRLKKLLGGRRFLIVLDDVWTTDEHQWRELQLCLDGGKVGSKIVVTARSLEVAHMVRSNIIYPLKGLSPDECWKLFRSWAFGEGRAQETSMLVERGNDIVRKCGGLPLAVEDLGGLRKRIEDAEWLRVQNTEIWKLSEETMNIIRSLKLSYQHMPFHLKQCFAYCSLFPKGYMFDKEKLISLWISEGFVLSSSEEALEDVGQTCFKSLLWRYFFEDVKERYQNHIETCKMHDVVQDLACSVGRDEFLSIVTDNYSTSQESHSSHRYLSLICHSLTLETLNHIFEANKFRSLILVPKDGHLRCNLKDGAWEVVAKLSLLRVLDLSSTNISELPQAVVSNLQHLRLLNMSNTHIKKLPESIVNLQCLITLILSYCRKLQELPNAMSNMSNLRHLDICGCHKLTRMPHHVGRLSNKLQHLPMFIVSEVEGHTIKELQNMKLIRGRLQIKNLHNVKSKTEAEAANLEAKIGLRQLELDWDGECEDIEGVAEFLRPNEYLEELMISGYKGNRFPSWMFSEGTQTRLCSVRELSIVNCKASTLSSWYEVLPHLTILETLKISNCEELDCLPDSFLRQQIPSLRTLDISGNENLTSLGGNGQNFPPNLFTSVHILMLGKCKSLVELPEWFGSITCLKSLDLSSCINIDRLQQLQMLNKIYNITLCRVLEERYKNETGTDWNGSLISNHREEIQQGRGEDETEKSTRGGKFSFKLFRKFVLVGCLAGSTVHE